MTLREECAAAMARNPGWRIWASDQGHPWAVRGPDADGMESSVTAGHMTGIDQAIAAFEREEQRGRRAA